MKTTRHLSLSFLFVLCLFAIPNQVQAQLTKIFVASDGNDANDGSRGAPMRTFQFAHDAVASGGQIVVLDTAGYGPFNITKSIAVTVPPGVNGFVTVTTGNGITINAGAGASVSLRGLIVEKAGSKSGNGILANSVGNLSVEDCTVRNFTEAIFVFSTTAAKVYLRNCVARGCTYGLDLEYNAAVAVIAIASGCQFDQNTNSGALAFAPSSFAGTVDLTLADCIISGNLGGVTSQNASAVVRVDNCRITGNSEGATPVSGGQILSRGNNTLEKNTSNNTFPGAYSAK
jgi:hypothetical protein